MNGPERQTTAPAESGREFRYHHPIEVRFRDTDALGHVNNAVYLTYFEAARAGYYRAVTGSVFDSEEGARRQSLIIARACVDYRAPAYFGETLIVECGAAWLGRSSFALDYRITAPSTTPGGDLRLIADGETVQVMFDYEAGRPIRIPAHLLERLANYEGRPIPPRPQNQTGSGRPGG
jgi:acyl-CoA thioester hydrolase